MVENPPVLAAGLCNSPCAGNPLLACGGDTEYLLYVNRAVNRPAYESYSATYLALPTPTYVCGIGGTHPPPHPTPTPKLTPLPPAAPTTTTATAVTTTYITQVITTSFPVTVSNNITVFAETTYNTTLPTTLTQLVGTFTETRTVLETQTVTTPYLATITWTTQGSTVTSVQTSSTTYTTVSTRLIRGPPRTVTETFTRDGVVRTTTVTRDPPVISDPPSNPPPQGRDCFGIRGCTLSLRFGLMRFPQTEPGEVCSIVTRSWVLGATELLPSATILPAIGEATDAPALLAPEEETPEPVIGAVTDKPEPEAPTDEDEPEPEIGSIVEEEDGGDDEGDVAPGPVAPLVPVAQDPEVLPEDLEV